MMLLPDNIVVDTHGVADSDELVLHAAAANIAHGLSHPWKHAYMWQLRVLRDSFQLERPLAALPCRIACASQRRGG